MSNREDYSPRLQKANTSCMAKPIMKKELAKFFSGFFAADVIVHIGMRLAGMIPITAFGMTLGTSGHTATGFLALFLSLGFGYYGWKK